MSSPPVHVSPRSERAAANRRGVLYLVAAMVCLILNDTLVKIAGQTMPVPQLVFVRGLMAVVMILAVARAMGAGSRLRDITDRHVLARATVDAIGTLLYLVSLMRLPIGNATAINLAAPLVMALGAVLFLRERPGLQRWLAIGGGFAGVVLVIQPKVEGFNAYALLCLAGTVFQTGRDLLTRRIDPGIPSILITLATAICVTLMAGGLTLMSDWQPLTWPETGRLALASALLASGYYLIVNSMRHGEMSLVAPFRYTGLPIAMTMGYLVWGEVPNGLAWGGIALLLAAGVYLLHGERQRHRAEEPLA